jgi:homoserine acetyltransferase
MVDAQYRMLSEGTDVSGLEMIVGTSMGCMHAFVWGDTHPGFARRLVPLACNAIEIAGRNRMFRQMIIDGFEQDPHYNDGNYADAADLETGLAIWANTLILAGSNPYRSQADAPTRKEAVEQLTARLSVIFPTRQIRMTRSTSSTRRGTTTPRRACQRLECPSSGSTRRTISSIRPVSAIRRRLQPGCRMRASFWCPRPRKPAATGHILSRYSGKTTWQPSLQSILEV